MKLVPLRLPFIVVLMAVLVSGQAMARDTDELFAAADKGDAVSIKKALAAGIDVNTADPDGWTALMIAASAGKLPAVQVLLKAGANVNAATGKGETALMAAALSGNAAIVKLLLAGGANKAAASAQGLTAADVAMRAKHPDLVKLLQPAPTTTVPAAPAPAISMKKIEAKVDAAAGAFQAGRYAEATELFREVVTLDPGHALAWHFLGQSLDKTGDLVGAWKAYGRSLEVQPQGPVATRTRQILARLSLPDTTKIILPSGLTLLDYMSMLDKHVSQGDSAALFAEVTGYIKEFGPYPALVKSREQFLNREIGAITLDSAESAKSALLRISQLKSLGGDTLKLTAMEAQAHHMAGNYSAAQAAYSRWLQAAPAQDGRRAGVADNLLKARQGQAPELMASLRQDCEGCSASSNLVPGAEVAETLVTFSGDMSGQEVAVEIPIAFGDKFGTRFNLRKMVEPAVAKLVESKLPGVRFGTAPNTGRVGLKIDVAVYGISFKPYYSDLAVAYKTVIAFTPSNGERSEKTIDVRVKGRYDQSVFSKSHNEAALATAIPELIRDSLVRELSGLLGSDEVQSLLRTNTLPAL